MKFSSCFALFPLLCVLFVGAAHCLPGKEYHPHVPSVPSIPTSKPIYSYFVEIDTIITRLSTWSPHDQSSDYPGAEKDLFELGKTIDQATQALKVYKGTIDTHSVSKIDSSLKSCAKNIVGITTNVKSAKAVFEKYSYTTLIVQILQASANQFSVLFPLLESHAPAASFTKCGYSIGLIICSIGDSIEYLQANTCTPEGLQFCKTLKDKKAGSVDTKPACQVVKPAEPFTQCKQSSTNMFKYGYDNKCLGKPQTQPWCNDTGSSKVSTNVEGSGDHDEGKHSKEVSGSHGDDHSSSSNSSSSFSAFFEVDISVVFGYTPAQSQLYTVCNPPK